MLPLQASLHFCWKADGLLIRASRYLCQQMRRPPAGAHPMWYLGNAIYFMSQGLCMPCPLLLSDIYVPSMHGEHQAACTRCLELAD